MADNRPLHSAALPWAQELSNEFCEKLDGLFEELWQRANDAAVEIGEARRATERRRSRE
jgi:hypothetical protein